MNMRTLVMGHKSYYTTKTIPKVEIYNSNFLYYRSELFVTDKLTDPNKKKCF